MSVTWSETREVPIDELTPFPGNAKRGDVAAIRASVRKNGQYRSLIVRAIENGPMVVLAGNHTMQALAAEGQDAARCEIVTCDDATARRINLADNRTAELGGYDNEALSELLGALDGDLDGTGYTETDLGLFTEPPPDLDALAEEFGEPEEEDLWPVLRLKVPPNARDYFYELTAGCERPEDDGVRFVHLLERIRAGK